MEKEFRCSKNALKKARITFWFYAACIPVIAVLFLLPFLINGMNKIEWVAIIYVLIILLFLYRGYRAFCVLRAVRKSYCRICNETVSGLNTQNPYQKSTAFQISKSEILETEEKVISVDRAGDIPHGPSLHRAPFSSTGTSGYRSVVIHTADQSYTLFAIELTEEMKEALARE